MSESLPVYDALFTEISQLVETARGQVQRNINTLMVQTYWHIGRTIVEHEQQGESRAAYGKAQLNTLAQQLTERFGKGFDATNLRNMRRFYQAFPIREAVSLELSWSHYNALARIENVAAGSWYMQEAVSQSWSVRALERQISVLYYERLLSSRERALVEAEAKEKTAPMENDPRDYLRDPYILDFLNLDDGIYQNGRLRKGGGVMVFERGRDPTPTLPLPGEGVREWCVLVPPPGKGEVRWGSILRSRIWAMLEIRKSAYGQVLGVKA